MKRYALIFFALGAVCFYQSSVYATENNSELTSLCWINVSNFQSTQLKAPCTWKNEYFLDWEGSRWRVSKDVYVVDGEGFLTFHRKDGYQSVKYKTEWIKGELNSNLNLNKSKFFKCIDKYCRSVELLIEGGGVFQGRVSFNADRTDFQFSGEGMLNAHELVYEGEIKDGSAYGLGRICIAPQGSTLPSLPENFDEDDCLAPNLFADGYWEGSRFQNGYIRQIYPSGMVYEGGYGEGLVEGWGTFVWPDGAKYQGDLADGKRNGVGTFQYSDGSIYEGEWRDGVKSGAGVLLIKPKQIKYIGEWENGTYQGDGLMEFADKSMLIGTFYNGKPNGECLFLSADKKPFQTVWQNGELVFFRPLGNANPQTSVSFSLIPSANAGVVSYLSDKAKSMEESLKSGVNAAYSFALEVKEHPEYLWQGIKGCVAGGSAAALTGATGGATAGAIVGSIIPGAGTLTGAGAGAVAGGVVEGVSGCLTQGTKAYMAKKNQGKDFSWSDAQIAFKEEFNLEHFAYGAIEGGLAGVAKVTTEVFKAAKRAKATSQMVNKAAPVANVAKLAKWGGGQSQQA